MRRLAFLCLCLLPLAFATPSAQAMDRDNGLFQSAQYYGDPCQDGRFSDGKARTCRELMRHRERQRDYRRARRERYHPCRDGRMHWGRPMTCAEVMEEYYGRGGPDWE